MKKRVISFLLAALMIFSLCAGILIQASAAEAMTTSEKGIALIKELEGFTAKPFYDYGQYSVGYGTACKYGEYPNGITKAEADKLLRDKLAKIEPDLNEFAGKNGLQLSQQQFDALISFTYNLGTNWMYNTSTLRTAVIQGAKGNDIIFAMAMWCNAGGSIVEGLIERRLAEANLYLNGIYSKNQPSNYRYVIFDNNTESAITTVKIQGYDANQTDILRAAPSKAGYRFLGWYTEADGGEWITKLNYDTPNKLYAHWQNVNSAELSGHPAKYVRYAGDGQLVYDNPYGAQIKTLKARTKLNITADYIDNDGIKWGKAADGWVKLNETKDAEENLQGQAVNMKVTVTTNGVNIRKGPGTSYPKAGKADKGQELQLTRVQQGGLYLWGQFSGGWICLDYTNYDIVSFENSENANKVTATGVIINADKLNIRANPGTGSAKVGTYSKGDKVEITLQKDVNGTTWGKTDKGWISLYYVKLTPVSENTKPEETKPTEPVTPTEPVKPTEPTPTEPAPTEPPATNKPTDKNEVVATGKITGCNSLRIRAGAGTKYPQVGSLTSGTKVKIYELVTVGTQIWGRVDKGWICTTYVKLDSADAVATGTIINCNSLNVRAGAGTTYAKVGKLSRGAEVEILETAKVGNVTWGRVEKGWISLFYVKLDGKLPESGSSQEPPKEETTNPTEPADKEDTETPDTPQQGTTDSTEKVNKTGVITGTAQLRVRQTPSADSKQVGTLKKGDRVVILETAKNGNATWGRTEQGWIHMFYVRLDSKEVPAGSIVRTVTTTLRIRAGAGTNYDAVGTYLRGTQVVITDQTTVGGTVWGRTDKGWISLYYVK